MKRLIASLLLLLLAFALIGCSGTLDRITGKVYQFKEVPGDQWQREIVFLSQVAVPAYGLSPFSDEIIFHSVVVWSGKRPDADKGVKPVMIGQGEKGVALLLFDNVQRKISLQMQGAQQENLTLLPAPGGVVAKNALGEVQYSAATRADGTIAIYDRESRLLQSFPPERVGALVIKKD